MTDPQAVIAAIIGGVATIAGAIVGVRWSSRRDPGAATALIEYTRSHTMLVARIEMLDRQARQRDEISASGLAANLERLEVYVVEARAVTARLERAAAILERDTRLDDDQRAKLAKIRDRISRGLARRPGSSAESDG